MAATVLLKGRSLALQAARLRATARDLRAQARAIRLVYERSVLLSSTRRLAKLAQGGSDGPLGDETALQETREQRCPYCRSDACDRRFLYVRKPTTLLGWMSEGRAVAED